jgi:hypothetical protein
MYDFRLALANKIPQIGIPFTYFTCRKKLFSIWGGYPYPEIN